MTPPKPTTAADHVTRAKELLTTDADPNYAIAHALTAIAETQVEACSKCPQATDAFPNAAEALAFLANVAAWRIPPNPDESTDIYRSARAEAQSPRNGWPLLDRVEAAADQLRAAGWLD
ncbi:MAG: hypothetical protein ACPGVG_12135 [Mycobacterium sp.]